jgi:hypothetical protein
MSAVCLTHLDDPSLGLGDEALVGGVSLDDLHVDPQAGAMRDDGVLEPLIGQRFGDRTLGAGGDPIQQSDPGGVLMRRGGQHDHGDDQAQHIYRQAPFPARHALGGIFPGGGGGDPGRDADALGVQHDKAWVG